MRNIRKILIVTLLTITSVCEAAKWYEDGTLTTENALAWQEATLANKVASSADFMATMYQSKMLNSNISNSVTGINDLAPYAIELAVCIDGATKKNPNPKKNKTIFTNQKISSMAAICATTMGWVK